MNDGLKIELMVVHQVERVVLGLSYVVYLNLKVVELSYFKHQQVRDYYVYDDLFSKDLVKVNEMSIKWGLVIN